MNSFRWLWHGPALAFSGAMILFVRGYQYCLRPILPRACIYEPGCSEYFIGSVRKHGPLIGGARGVWRLCRCHPWGSGGYDPP
jgi:uncharacterized protein